MLTISNEIYGFADFLNQPDFPAILHSLRDLTPFGVFSVPERDLIGFPPDLHSTANSFVFVIGDSPKSMNAEYTLDYQDFDPQAHVGLPINADERLELLTTLLTFLFDAWHCIRIAVCLTVCNQVDSVKHVVVPHMLETIRHDCAKESPPCAIYVITLRDYAVPRGE